MILLKPYQSWILAFIFVFLPLKPEIFAGILIILGFTQIKKFKDWLIPPGLMLISIILVVSSQILSSNEFIEINPNINHDESKNNLIKWQDQFEWRGYEAKVKVGLPGAVRNGFVYLPRAQTQNNALYTAIIAPMTPLRLVSNDKPLTFSFYLKSTQERPTFWIGFWAKDGGAYPVQPQFIPVSPHTWRVVGTFAPSKPEYLERVSLENIKGKWAEIGLSAAQLWDGTDAITFSLNAPKPNQYISIIRWGLQGLMAVPLLIGSLFLLKHVRHEQILIALLVGVTLHTGIALYEFLNSASRDVRVVGLTDQPNFLGHLAVVSVAVLILLGGWVWGFTGLFLAGVITFLTGSRAALLGSVGLLIFWFTKIPTRYKLALIGATFVLGVLLFQPWQGGRLTDIGNLNYFTTQARLQTWEVARAAIPENPWFGIGLDNFRYLYLNHRPEGAVEAEITHAHNLFLQLLVGSGIVGLSGFLLLLGWIILRLIRWHQWQVIMVIFIIIIINLVDYTWFTAGIYSALWLAIAFGFQSHKILLPNKITI